VTAADMSRRADGSATEPVTVMGDGPLARAVRSQRGGGGEVLLIDHGDDARTVAALHSVLDNIAPGSSPPTIVAQVADRRLRRAVQSRVAQAGVKPRPILVGASSLIAEHFVAAEHLFELAYWRDQPRLHVVLVGFDHLGQSFFDELVSTGIAGELQRPLIRIVTPDEAGARAFLQREMPEIDKSAEIVISACALADLGDPTRSPLVEAEGILPLTAILLLLDEETDTLLASSAVVDLQDRHGFANAALFIGGPGSDEACALATPMRSPRNLGRKISRIDDLGAIDSLLDYILEGRDALARQFHDAYLREYAGKTGAGTPWDTLSETYRRANRRAAWHLAQKLWTLGLSIPDDASLLGSVDPVTYENVIKPLAASAAEDDTVRRLARLEHERWCAERRLDGWEHGEVRDDTRRRHPSLVSFDDPRLTADDIAKDIGQVRFLLGSVVRPAQNGAATRFVTGVVSAPAGAQAGISVKELRERLAHEPQRFATILSPLITEREVAATLALVEALDAKGRDFCLIVPEWYPDNKTVRADAAARAPGLLALLARSQTRIAPIGPAGFFKDDVWEDPSATDAAREALARYVMRRSHALVAVDGD
jgi:RyR domain